MLDSSDTWRWEKGDSDDGWRLRDETGRRLAFIWLVDERTAEINRGHAKNGTRGDRSLACQCTSPGYWYTTPLEQSPWYGPVPSLEMAQDLALCLEGLGEK